MVAEYHTSNCMARSDIEQYKMVLRVDKINIFFHNALLSEKKIKSITKRISAKQYRYLKNPTAKPKELGCSQNLF